LEIGELKTRKWIPCQIYQKCFLPFERYFPYSFLKVEIADTKTIRILRLAQRTTEQVDKFPKTFAWLLVTFHSVFKSSSYSVFHPYLVEFVLGQIPLYAKCKAKFALKYEKSFSRNDSGSSSALTQVKHGVRSPEFIWAPCAHGLSQGGDIHRGTLRAKHGTISG
jgi:hypothetical protein